MLFLLALAISPRVSADDPKPSDDRASKHKMLLEVTVSKPDESRRYRKPYVAVWLADKEGFPVRTLALWIQQDAPGPRWYPDLRQWYRDDRVRKLADGTDLIDGMSGATRAAGKYKVAWDGKDDAGHLLPAGDYTLMVEAAREHGTYQLIQEKLTLGSDAFKKVVKGNIEIESVKIDYLGNSKN